MVSPFAVSVVTIEEIGFGLSWKPNARLEPWFDRFFAERCEVLSVSEPIARRAGALRGQLRAAGRTRTQADMLLAATAHVHQLPLATPNPHFSPAFCCGRRSARRGGPYSLTPLRRSYDYACSVVQS
ncbi:MAG: PIN domain-containing protein, partial [Acidobacteria bacterium]|nr:PIN domain-containing protein [Acidobacteriota bacterium]